MTSLSGEFETALSVSGEFETALSVSASITNGAIYYLDATSGDDSNAGTSSSTAWKTIAKVNAATFKPGDRVLLKRGETWTGTVLTVPSSGATGAPITFGTYGSGDRPIIDGNDTVNCFIANSRSHLQIENLDLTQASNFGIQLQTSNNIVVNNCDCHDAGNDNLNIMTGSYDIIVNGGKFYNGYAIEVGPQVSGIEVADGCYDITIDGAECYDNIDAGAGITVHSHDGTGMPYNITIKNVNCHDNAAYGLNLFKQDDTLDTDRNILIEDSEFDDNTLDGIRISKAVGADNYPDGITFDGCEAVGNTRYAIWGEGDNITLRKSLFHEGRTAYFRDFKSLTVYNCTFYMTTWAGYGPLRFQDSGTARADRAEVKNCIFASPDAATYIGWSDVTTNIDYDYNLYFRPTDGLNRFRWDSSLYNWANWKIQSSGDANGQLDDPTFTDAGNDDFTLQAGSPAINAGVDVGLSYNGAAPDLGANETT